MASIATRDTEAIRTRRETALEQDSMEAVNYSTPPVPARPHSISSRDSSLPPPVPPLPPGYRREEPLAAPRPQRLDPDLPAHMARTLDEHLAYNDPRLSTPQPPPGGMNMGVNHMPGFAFAGAPAPFYGSPPLSGSGMPMIPMPQIQVDGAELAASMAGLSVNASHPPRQRAVSGISPVLPVSQMGERSSRARALSTSGPPQNFDPYGYSNPPLSQYVPPPATSSPPRASSGGAPSLTATLPTISSLQAALPAIQSPSADVNSKVAWIRDVLLLVNRSTDSTSSRSPASIDPTSGPARIIDSSLQRLTDVALPLLITLAPGIPSHGQKLSAPLAEALHIRAVLTASGAFPAHLPQNQRSAFREFEAAARSGYSSASWFRLGRDYESFGDVAHAVDCFDRGARAGDESCLYRLGMANLLGQLNMAQDLAKALPMLQKAATLASIGVPQPAYVYALLLFGDLSSSSLPLTAPIPPQLIAPLIPPGSSASLEARKHLERAAFLHFTPAQYKLGHAYEFAEPPFAFDALLSVQYYSLASQAGEAEADLALSRWFLCGSDGSGVANSGSGDTGFAKDEKLAYTFGEKAARKGLPSAEFAMGYYWEVGVGVPSPDVQRALGWYELAASHGNSDASQRVMALKRERGQALTRQEHDAITENKLVRKRTQAKARSEAAGAPTSVGGRDASHIVEGIRKNSQIQGQQSFQPRQSSLAAQARQQDSLPHGHQTPPPPMPNTQDSTQRLRDRPRYSLVDPGSGSSSPPPGATVSPRPSAGRGAGRRVVSGAYNQGSPHPENVSLPASHATSPVPTPAPPPETIQTSSPAPSGGGTRYNTFADMGVQGGKAEDKECVIM